MTPHELPFSRFLGRGVRRDVDDEIRHHIEESADLLMEQGWDREPALREAERRFGAVRRFRAEMLAVRGEGGAPGSPLARSGAIGREIAQALRGLARRPGFALPLLLTLALGIGAAAAVFSIVDAALVRPLAYRNADRLVALKPSDSGGTGTLAIAALPDFLAGAGSFSDGWLAYRRETLVRTDAEVPEQLAVLAVTPGADTLLGIPLLLGRSITPEDARPGSPDVIVLSRRTYERWGGDPSWIGRRVRLESGQATVVGVLRGRVRFPDYGSVPDAWMPLREDFTFADRQSAYAMESWMRLAPGVTSAAAEARAEGLAAGLREAGLLAEERGVQLPPVGAFRGNAGTRRGLWALAATGAALLLVALVNGVNLLIVRGSSRARELAVRIAIGGSRAAVVRLLLVEGVALGLAGGLAGLAVAWLAVRGAGAILPSELLFFTPHEFGVERRTVAVVLAASLLAGAALGLLPALQVLRPGRARSPLTGRPTDDAPSARRLRSGLVAAQVALATTLLAAAALFVKSATTLLGEDPGFEAGRVAIASIPLSEVRYAETVDRADLLRRLRDALEARPEIERASAAHGGGFMSGAGLQAEGTEPPEERPSIVPYAAVWPDYLDVVGADLVDGRGFLPEDAGTDAAIVDRDLARFLWGAESPVGRRFRVRENDPWYTVVGVVRELRLMGRDQRQGPHQFLLPADPDRPARSYAEFVARTSGDPAALLPILAGTLRELDPEQYIWKLQTGAQALAEEEGMLRFLVTLTTVLAGVAVVLAALGLYGVLAYSVTRRNRELGIRVALGADRRRVRRMVLGEGLAVAALGIALGTGAALLATRALAQLLYEVEPGDPSTLLATAALFLVVATVASLLPAARATRVDPVEVLRAD